MTVESLHLQGFTVTTRFDAFTKTDNRLRPNGWKPVININIYDNLGIMRLVGLRKVLIKHRATNPINLR